ncbi:ribonuclease P protein component [Candidatus Bipolaricaulota bacterium]|nr:ribonuclease P protein component [Candidatus Bipolaricaulota bacterium]
MSDNRFPKANRLVSESDFSRVYEEGFRFDGDVFVFYLLENEISKPRVGIVTPKYLGSATKRNRIKRIIRESFRKDKEIFEGFDFIVRPTEVASNLSNVELTDRFLSDFRASKKVVKNGD